MTITRSDKAAAASTVLIIDNDPLMLTAMGSVLDMQGHRATLARSESIAMQSIAAGKFDVIILSIEALNAGCEFAARLRNSDANRDIPIIFLVPEMSADWLPKLAAEGGVFSVLKPVDPHALIDLVEKALWMPHVAKSYSGLASGNHLSNQSDWIKLRD